ncbi:MAG: glutamate racemase [Limnohabitans sp.]
MALQNHTPALEKTSAPHSPVGVFDSGVGGLSILRALQIQLPNESFVYLADSGFAPYGERDKAFVLQRARSVLHTLLQQHQIKALVIACNTATALAIHVLRQEFPALPIFGVEPAIKPAALQSRTHRIGVMATAGTLGSAKFQELHRSLHDQAEFVLQACDGLADAIEQQWQQPDNRLVLSLCRKYLDAMGEFGTAPHQIDTVVLGCTHYPFAKSLIQNLLGPHVSLVDTGDPVARRVAQVLNDRQLLANPNYLPYVKFMATGEISNLESAAKAWLQLSPSVSVV